MVAKQVTLKAAVHITGDAYLKFDRLTKFSNGIGFEFDNFDPPPIFTLIQETASKIGAKITDEEMFRTFNMGWGFAVVVNRTDVNKALDTFEKTGVESEQIGQVTRSSGIRILHKKRKIILI
jgi:phosphoribosylformylglycinamidine cyclo-ligase